MSTESISNWQPAQEGLEQLVALFRSSNSPDSAVQMHIRESITKFKSIPDFNNYLVFIFARLKTEQDYVRSVAGLVLKNNIREQFNQLPPEYQAYIRNEVLSCVGDPMLSVRRAVATIITTIAGKIGIQNWPGLLQTLFTFLDSPNLDLVEGSFSTLAILCEDFAHKMDSESLGRPLNVMIPKILTFFKSPHGIIRKHAITCINQFIAEMPNALLLNMDPFLLGIFDLAVDQAPEVRRKVCQAFVMLAEVRIEYLVPHMTNVVRYILHATQDRDEDVSLEACEFFSAIAETRVCKQSLGPVLPQVVQVLLSRMVYADDDPNLIAAEEEEDVVDKQNEVKPFFHRSATKGSLGNSGGAPQNQSQAPPANDDDDDEDEDDDDDEDDESLSEWNIRKCAAAGIDILSLVFRDDILPHVLQVVQERINNKADWKVRESAILTLGAIAEGCLDGMRPHLIQLVPYLVTFLSDPQPLVRSITCWTLSRYSRWIVRQRDVNTFLRPVVSELLQRILDKNKKVQEASCSAFATLEEEGGAELTPYLAPILQTLTTAFGKYQAKNLLILYDAIGTLADSAGQQLNNPEYINILMPPLIVRWNALPDDDKALLPLLECLTSISTALGVGFQHFALPVFQRCLRLIDNTIAKEEAALRNECEYPDKEFMVCALDLISGIIDGLQTGVESLIANTSLIRSLLICCKDVRPDVRQSAFATVGDLAKNCIVHLRPVIHEYIPIIIQNITKDYVAVCNNSSWAIGEIAIRIGDEMKPYALEAMDKLVPLLHRPGSNQNLLENIAITIGRLGLICTEMVAPFLDKFVQQWCLVLRDMRDDNEKDSAFRGLCKMTQANPNAVVKYFPFVCDAIGSWENPQPDLKQTFTLLLHGFKNSMDAATWSKYFASFPENLQFLLKQKYQL